MEQKEAFFISVKWYFWGVTPENYFTFLNQHLGFTSQSKIRVIYILFLSHYSIQTSTEE